jgi:hypothetical protein
VYKEQNEKLFSHSAKIDVQSCGAASFLCCSDSGQNNSCRSSSKPSLYIKENIFLLLKPNFDKFLYFSFPTVKVVVCIQRFSPNPVLTT